VGLYGCYEWRFGCGLRPKPEWHEEQTQERRGSDDGKDSKARRRFCCRAHVSKAPQCSNGNSRMSIYPRNADVGQRLIAWSSSRWSPTSWTTKVRRSCVIYSPSPAS